MKKVFWATAVFFAVAAHAAEYPSRPTRMIVPQAPGSASDTVARLLAAELSPRLGQQVVVDNRPGGALMIGMEMTARAAPDGYTIGYAPVGGLVISPNVSGKPPYDSNKDFAAIIMTAFNTMLLASNPNFAVKNIRELIDYAKANPGKLSNASSGNGTPGHVGMEYFKLMTGTQMVHVPYKGGGAALIATVGGEADLSFIGVQPALPHIQGNKLRALGITSAKRSPTAPEIPPLAEAGLPGYDAVSWHMIVAPGATPKPIVEKLHASLREVASDATFRAEILKRGFVAQDSAPPDALAAYVKSEIVRWGDVVRKAGAAGIE